MSQLYDVIVIGASEEGISFCEQLLAKTVGLKVALVSRNFNRPVEIAGLTKITGEVIFSSYNPLKALYMREIYLMIFLDVKFCPKRLV
jgi:hypothetical protein